MSVNSIGSCLASIRGPLNVTLMVRLAAVLLAQLCASVAGLAPVSYWRYEDPANLGADSTTGGVALTVNRSGDGTSPWAARNFSDGGIVGGYIEVRNTSLGAMGGIFPRTTTAAGVTVEMLFRAGRDFQRYGNTTLFAVTPTASPAAGWIEAGLLRHSLVWRADASLAPDKGECISEQDAVLPGPVPCSRMEVPLDQAGRRSMFYIDDGNWHHIAFRKAAVSGEQSIWLDGQAPDGFASPFGSSATGTAIPQPQSNGNPQPFSLLPSHFDGALDEVALWHVALSDELIAQHYKDAMAHRPYSTAAPTAAVPKPDSVAGLLRPTDFALGTICEGWKVNCTYAKCNHSWPFQGAKAEGVTRGTETQLNAVEQLKAFPAPRLVPTSASTFGRNIAWFGYSWLTGVDNPESCYACKNQTCFNSVGDHCFNKSSGRSDAMYLALESELATNWNYPFFISHDGLKNSTIALFNAKPEIPIGHTISRGDISTLGAPGGHALDISIVNRPECFLQNAKGQAITPQGNPRPKTTCNESLHGPNCCSQPGTGGRCVLRPCVSCAFDCMDAIAKQDGAKYLAKFAEWQSYGLKRPLELLFDDGEYLGWYNNLAHALDVDPVMVADYEKLQIDRLPGGQRDWMTYTSRWRAKNTETFKAAMLNGNPTDLTYNATYGEYTVGGTGFYRPNVNDSWEWQGNGKWAEMRKINSPGRTSHSGSHMGMSMYYPWNPDGRGCAVGGTLNVPPQGQQALWDSSGKMASWDGLDFLSLSRPGEINAGDQFFSPFIAPGWSEKEELNLRPSQDLAILKHLMGAGAEYIHVGFFNGVARGSNWIWQAAMPVYSQGVATAVADLWRHSHLLAGDMPNAEWACYTIGTPLRDNVTLQETCSKFPLAAACGETNVIGTGDRCTAPNMPESGWHAPVSFRFWSGSQSIPVFVRKHDTKEQYLITASVQPQSNMIGNAPDAANVTIFLGELRLRFEARRQGSVYILDLTTSDSGTLTQADSWHELGHPQHWSKCIEFQAELHTAIASNTDLSSLYTRSELRDGALHALDFVGSTSFVDISAASTLLEYHFQPRGTLPVEYVVWMRARAVGDLHSEGCTLAIGLDGQHVGEKSCGSADFSWLRLDSLLIVKPSEIPHALSIHVLSGRVHIDVIRLRRADKGDHQHLHHLKSDDYVGVMVALSSARAVRINDTEWA